MRDTVIPALIGTGALTALVLLTATTRRGRRLLSRGYKTGLALSKDDRIPRVIRWALLASFVLPIPGELDELLGLLILAAMWPRYGHVIRATWEATATATA